MALQTQRRTRQDTPMRWHKAAQRAITEQIAVAQLQGSGQWIATSSQPGVAYELAVTGNVAHGCSCLAGMNDDPVCKHRAAYYLLIGALFTSRICPGCGAAAQDGDIYCGACGQRLMAA